MLFKSAGKFARVQSDGDDQPTGSQMSRVLYWPLF